MPLQVKDGLAATVQIAADGAGTLGDPYVLRRTVQVLSAFDHQDAMRQLVYWGGDPALAASYGYLRGSEVLAGFSQVTVAGTAYTIHTPTTGSRFVLTGLVITATTATTVNLREATTPLFPVQLGANIPLVIMPNGLWRSMAGAVNNALTFVSSTGTPTVGGTVFGYEVVG